MPRQHFRSALVRHQVNLPEHLDDAVIMYCEENCIDLRQLITIALTTELQRLGVLKPDSV